MDKVNKIIEMLYDEKTRKYMMIDICRNTSIYTYDEESDKHIPFKDTLTIDDVKKYFHLKTYEVDGVDRVNNLKSFKEFFIKGGCQDLSRYCESKIKDENGKSLARALWIRSSFKYDVDVDTNDPDFKKQFEEVNKTGYTYAKVTNVGSAKHSIIYYKNKFYDIYDKEGVNNVSDMYSINYILDEIIKLKAKKYGFLRNVSIKISFDIDDDDLKEEDKIIKDIFIKEYKGE